MYYVKNTSVYKFDLFYEGLELFCGSRNQI